MAKTQLQIHCPDALGRVPAIERTAGTSAFAILALSAVRIPSLTIWPTWGPSCQPSVLEGIDGDAPGSL